MSGKHLPLAMINPSEEVTVAEIRGGRGLVRRLADMGLTPGTTLKVINSQMPGPILIDLRGSRLVLGHGVALKIMVEIAGNG
ncbi:MAG: ferrous iron transport protein A [Dehalococcoidia bacterium]|jgi:ferrous iron transport protein A|nr:ferrous iron transport protein A [Dehalococcoidia bacterium]